MRLALVLFLVTSTALASGSLAGRVTSAGKPLANVTVSAGTDAMPKPFVTMTEANGAYVLPFLPPGTYDVTFSLAGHQTLTRRAEVRAHERTRVDGDIEPSDEGESVTQTAANFPMQERPQSVWSLDRDTAESLPLGRHATAWLEVAPAVIADMTAVDGIYSFGGLPVPESLDQMSFVFAGASADIEWIEYGLLDMRTRSSRAFSASLRSTMTRLRGYDAQHHEGSIGGRWMFVAAEDREGFRFAVAKATAAVTSRDTATLTFLGGDIYFEDITGTWLHVAPRFSAVARGSRDYAALRGYTLAAGKHEIAGGVEYLVDRWSGFVRDRWDVSDRLVVEGGLRVENDEVLPRAGAVFDLDGDGRTRLVATYSDFHVEAEGAIGIARRLGSSGYARALVTRRGELTAGTLDGTLQWLLFTFGVTAAVYEHASFASAWAIIDPPLPNHDLRVSLLQRYRAGFSGTDVAVTYAYPFTHVMPFVKLDVVNLFDRNDDPIFVVGPTGRTYSFGVGVRFY